MNARLPITRPSEESSHSSWLAALSRHVVWLVAVLVVLGTLVRVRLDVQVLRQQLDKTGREIRQAEILHDRLRLEADARKRAASMEQAAARFGLSTPTRVLNLSGTP